MAKSIRILSFWLGTLLAIGCGATATDPADREDPVPTDAIQGPRIRVLGTAQDGGFPHAGCDCVRCLTATEDPSLRRSISSLAIVLPGSSQVFVIDATPDFRSQLAALRDVRPHAGQGRVDRQPLSGIFLTHAHLGHYTGLGFLGFEAIHTRGLSLHASSRMISFLGSNEPWATLLRDGALIPQPLEPDRYVELGEGVAVKAFAVPHRDELSDTVAFVVRGPRNTVLFVPDTDNWEDWNPDLPTRLARDGITLAWIDGTFYSDDELPARAVSSIGHPRIVESLEYLKKYVAGGGRVSFTHLNHSNPVLDPDSVARRQVLDAGFGILEDGYEAPL